MSLVDKAFIIALTAHDGQSRKYSTKPYISHPVAVFRILRPHLYVQNPYLSLTEDEIVNIKCAAYLHDVIEDCDITKEYLAKEVNIKVASIVRELTNTSKGGFSAGLSRSERKALDRQQISDSSLEARLIKLADRIHNLESLIDDYHEEIDSFCGVYCLESVLLLDVLRGTYKPLEDRLRNTIDALNKKIKYKVNW